MLPISLSKVAIRRNPWSQRKKCKRSIIASYKENMLVALVITALSQLMWMSNLLSQTPPNKSLSNQWHPQRETRIIAP